MNNETLIQAENIALKINGNKLFHNLSFALEKGEALQIVGSNGSGKSTLIRIILGITKQTKGNVNYKNNINVSYLGHKNALKSYLSVYDNLMLQELNNHKELHILLERLELKNFLDVTVGNLSYGQQKKLAMLRVFLNKSNLIVLDEPFVGLDSKAFDIVQDFLMKEINSGKSLIFTSHIDCNIESKILNLR